MRRVRHVSAVTTDRYIVLAYEKVEFDDSNSREGGFYIASIDRSIGRAEDLPQSYDIGEKVQEVTGCIELLSVFLNGGIVYWAFYEKNSEKWRHRLCYGVYNGPGDFRTCTDQECEGKVTSVTVGGLQNGAIMFWNEESECDNLYTGSQKAHFLPSH